MSDEPAWAKGRPKPPEWRAGEGRVRFENPWLKAVEYDAVAPTGANTHYGVIRFQKLAVGVLPVWEDGTVTLVGQRRFPLNDYAWEMPEGGVPFDEDPLDGAKRELREEVGLEAADWRLVLRMQLSNSTTDERAVCFLATGFTQTATEPDETEALDVVRVPFRDLLTEVVAGRVQDSMTVATTLRAYHMAREGELPDALARAMLG
ncbi:MAG TPA: NUDIX hydrolase [Caulobacteraceae bacterium]|nr:NUDIX hydrolase [Caulobacteraceae bacterium]